MGFYHVPGYCRSDDSAVKVVELSRWVDGAQVNEGRNAEALTWHRVCKVAEEAGEVVEAMIGWTGGNPRKGKSHGLDNVIGELLDVVISALGAVEHLDGHRGASIKLMMDKIDKVHARAGLTPESSDYCATEPFGEPVP